jgi:hypothetical protein
LVVGSPVLAVDATGNPAKFRDGPAAVIEQFHLAILAG